MKMKTQFTNRILSLVLALVMVVGLMPITALALNTLQQDSDGYYLIGNEDDLFEFAQIVNGTHASIAKNTSANGKLTADIAMTGSSRPWTPIASTRMNADAYRGTFDGQGHTISNLYFNDLTAFNAGLFGLVYDGTVRNVIVADGYIAAIWGGAIAGEFYGDGRIEGCGNLNTTVTAGEVGGIVGDTDSTIIACWNTGTISGSTWAGGICSYLSGSVKGCWNTGKITGERCGGIVGAVGGSRTVAYCYNDGMVVSSDNDLEGAIIGSNNGSGRPKMSDCYYTYPHGGAYKAYGEEYDYYYTNVDDVSSSMLPTGEGALFLNQGLAGTGYQYYQNLDNGKTVDAYPVADSSHGTVHRGYKVCSDTYSYSNSALPQSIYHEGVNYKAEGQTVTAVCTNEACRISNGLGSITLDVSSEYYYTGNPVKATVTGALQTGATHKITYNGSEEAPGQVGNHTAKLAVYEGSNEKASVSANFKISYLSTPAILSFNVSDHGNYDNTNGTYWFASRAVAKVTAPEGSMISTASDGAYGGFVYFDEDDSKIVYLKRVSDGAMTDAIDLSAILKWDATAPTGEVRLSVGNFWTQLINKFSFGMFFKERQEVTITAQDTGSGMKSIQYHYWYEDLINDSYLSSAEAAARLEAAIGDDWKDYNGPIELWQDGRYIVYAKLTDNVGNVTYVSSNGFVQYSDATSATTSLSTPYKAGEDRDISVALNNNTVKEVKRGNIVLAETDYTVSGDKITLKSEYLDTLAAGDYTITISLNPQGVPYVEAVTNEKPAELTVSLTVNTRQVAVPADDNRSFVYDGSEQTYSIAPSDWYTVTGNQQTDAGIYTVTVALKDKDNTVWSDGTTGDKTYEFHIEKKVVDLSVVKWNYTGPFKYDGLTHGVDIDESTMPYGASVSNYTGHSGIETGKRRAAAAITYDANHKGEGTLFLDWEIKNAWTPTEYTVSTPNGNGWMNKDFVITANAGYKVSLTNTANGEWKESLTYSGETADSSVTFYLKDESDGAISLAKTVSYKLDRTPATGKVSFTEEDFWVGLLASINFELFYNTPVSLTAEADDGLSGVARIEYASSDEGKTMEEVEIITDWTEYTDSVSITREEAQRFVYFVRITDKAGNVTYLSTDGAEYDTTAPAIIGIENGQIYYTTQRFTVKESNLENVTVNGNQSMTLSLGGNVDKEYVVVATDKAGNSTTVTVTMKPISELAQPIAGVTEDNVNSDNENAVEGVIDEVDRLLEDEALPDREKQALTDIRENAEALMEKIGQAEAAVDTEDIRASLNVTPDNVTPENRDSLEGAVEDLEKALEEHGSNYTGEEQQIIQDVIQRFEEALTVLDNAQASQDQIGALPGTVVPDDEKTVTGIEAAKKAYDALNEHEKYLVGKEAKEKLDKLVAAITAYDIVKGDGSAWTKGGSSLSFTANGPYSKFAGIKVDGKAVDKANYDAVSGSTVITFKAAYLDTLAAGEHTVTVLYNDGEASGSFSVKAKSVTPPTGDAAEPVLWTFALAVSAMALALLFMFEKKKKTTDTNNH